MAMLPSPAITATMKDEDTIPLLSANHDHSLEGHHPPSWLAYLFLHANVVVGVLLFFIGTGYSLADLFLPPIEDP